MGTENKWQSLFTLAFTMYSQHSHWKAYLSCPKVLLNLSVHIPRFTAVQENMSTITFQYSPCKNANDLLHDTFQLLKCSFCSPILFLISGTQLPSDVMIAHIFEFIHLVKYSPFIVMSLFGYCFSLIWLLFLFSWYSRKDLFFHSLFLQCPAVVEGLFQFKLLMFHQYNRDCLYYNLQLIALVYFWSLL